MKASVRPTSIANILFVATQIIVSGQAIAANDNNTDVAEIVVHSIRVANTEPAGTYATPATLLRFDPLTEIQARGLPEGQADVTVRGGLFENTGFKLGAATIADPQTGHYSAELPIDPALLSTPIILTGVDNAIAGFNSNVATVSYSLPAIRRSGTVSTGAGSNDLRYSEVRLANTTRTNDDVQYGFQLSGAFSEGSGTVDNGDHKYGRYNLQTQRVEENSQTDLIIAYQDKFYGWPGAYTGFASLPETDDTKTTLILANHRAEIGNGWLQLTGFYRRLVNDYDFDRRSKESGIVGAFEHMTKNFGIGFDGVVEFAALNWNFSGQLTQDELVRSTDLINSPFTNRQYATFRLAPSTDIALANNKTLTVRFGGVMDMSNRDSDVVSPVLDIILATPTDSGFRSIKVEYAGTSQLPGYTALASKPTGLFGGNPDLGREKARQFIVTLNQQGTDWFGSAAVFYREDDNLVDWTYAFTSSTARQANPVDMDVTGFELLFQRQWDRVNINFGYTLLDKDADYGSAAVDASFYALNFAKSRATVAMTYQLGEQFALRLDNEYREQQSNSLRTSDDTALQSSASLAWSPAQLSGFSAELRADNLTDNDYQQYPGTPAAGRQISLNARYSW